ncbi:hypothetical protein [Nocardia terpenica]|uniref:TPR repeat domain-containing protein n=1 Tax=Nocardia terpenica TaxID=455432 RepID=A0A164KR28_9NOCA|nr:hypothetical protein [Nocardia terpenica]KZM71646.1 hypothetical protein AWN90_02675 [Nocardia terpenica]NQE90870.1 hypothetical protein [Nocardia terpenica]
MVAPGSTSLLRSNVEKWRVPALTDLAAALAKANNETFGVNIEQPKKHFADLGTSWQGAAYNAAYDRVGQDHDQARKVWAYVDDLVTAIRNAAADIDSHRTVLLTKVNDARSHGLTVADNWVIPDKDGVPVDTINALQDAINLAFYPFRDAVANTATKISEAAELVRTAGDLFGSDLDVTDAPSQGGRTGAEDGKEAAEAAKNGDPAKLDEVAAHLPTHVLTPEQMQALSEGKDVPTLPAEVQDYYKEFFKNAGKDGVLALQDHLQQEATATPDHPASTVAAAQQRALADGMMTITDEHVGTGIGPNGKLSSPGAYTNLPPDIRQLISGREQEYVGDKSGPGDTVRRMQDRMKLANLLGNADPNMTGGTTFSTELGRQAQSMAQYLDSSGGRPIGFTDEETKSLNDAATKFLNTATRNHEADYQLLTGHGLDGQKIPADLSFGANGNQYRSPGDYDPQKFADTVFRNHTWPDQGKAASNLFEWAGQHTHDPGAQLPGTEGNRAREVVAKLPQLLAPHHGDSLDMGPGNKSLVQSTTDSFNKNPEFANSLSRVITGNLDSFADQGTTLMRHDPNIPVEMQLRDSQRLLFLANQTEEGRQTLETARQSYDNAVAYQLANNQIAPESQVDTIRKLATLDAHITDSRYNALTYQHGNDIAQQNDQALKSYNQTKDISDVAKKIVDAVPVPGGPVGTTVKNIAEDQAYKAIMNGVNPPPTPHLLQFPYADEVQKSGNDEFGTRLQTFLDYSANRPPQQTLNSYYTQYQDNYDSTIDSTLVKNSSDLEQLATGGQQAPKKPGS